MHAARAHTRTSLASLALGLLLLVGGILDIGAFAWFRAHGLVLTLGTVLAGLAALHAWTLDKLADAPLPEAGSRRAAALWLFGILLLSGVAAGGDIAMIMAVLGFINVAAGATMHSILVMKHAPKGGLTDMDRDKLTKGDDACLKHVHFAHRFLPIGLLLLIPAAIVTGVWGPRLHITAIHIIVIGYGLLSIYGLSHFWVPRLSGIPAIAGGAIKGELHTSLLGIVGVTVGFLVGHNTSVGRGFLVGLGPMVFLGFFVWMGVLGANIMKNKSPTNSVRPEFVYIPWVFSAVFWLVTAVLMGIFLNVLPDDMSHLLGALRFSHLHTGLLGGAVQLLLGLTVRLLPMHLDQQPPRFGQSMKGSFYLFNLGLAFAAYGRFQGPTDTWLLIGLATISISLGLYAMAMGPYFRALALRKA